MKSCSRHKVSITHNDNAFHFWKCVTNTFASLGKAVEPQNFRGEEVKRKPSLTDASLLSKHYFVIQTHTWHLLTKIDHSLSNVPLQGGIRIQNRSSNLTLGWGAEGSSLCWVVPWLIQVFHSPHLSSPIRGSGVLAGVAAATLKLGQWAELQLLNLLTVPCAVSTLSCWNTRQIQLTTHTQFKPIYFRERNQHHLAITINPNVYEFILISQVSQWIKNANTSERNLFNFM